MKKLSMLLIILSLFIGFSATNVYAKAIGIKGGYTMPKDDFSDYENTWAFGVYFDMGKFLFDSLSFRPGIDYISLEGEDDSNGKYGPHDVYGIHLDWYWHFLDKGSIAPFIGFGPSLNYLDFQNEDETDDGDSDAGVDLFLGLDVKIGSTPLTLMVEGRFKFFDIAARNDTAVQGNLGIAYNF